MAVIVETGAIVANANAYCDVAYVTAYAAARALDFAGSDAEKEAAIIKATDYIDARYAFNGNRQSATQELSWPRAGASDRDEGIDIPENTVPSVLKRAVAELAIKAFAGRALLEDQARGGRIVSQSVGSISVTYESGDGVDVGTKFGITGLLKGLVSSRTDNPRVYFGQSADGGYFKSGQFDNEGTP